MSGGLTSRALSCVARVFVKNDQRSRAEEAIWIEEGRPRMIVRDIERQSLNFIPQSWMRDFNPMGHCFPEGKPPPMIVWPIKSQSLNFIMQSRISNFSLIGP